MTEQRIYDNKREIRRVYPLVFGAHARGGEWIEVWKSVPVAGGGGVIGTVYGQTGEYDDSGFVPAVPGCVCDGCRECGGDLWIDKVHFLPEQQV